MASSNLGEPRVPKPKNQGSAGSPSNKQPLHGGNSHSAAPRGVVKGGVHREGVGGKGAKNNPKRT